MIEHHLSDLSFVPSPVQPSWLVPRLIRVAEKKTPEEKKTNKTIKQYGVQLSLFSRDFNTLIELLNRF